MTRASKTPSPGSDSRARAAANRQSKSDLVAGTLRALIERGEYQPGARLRQRHVAKRLGVSPTPVREALRRLESEGLVHIDIHRGATVVPSDPSSIEENFRFRAALESLATSLAVRKLTEADLKGLEEVHRHLRQLSPHDPRIHELNRELHFRLYESARSPVLTSLLRLLWQAFPGGPQVSRPHAESVQEHEELLRAIRSRDPDTAAACTRSHILGALRYLPGRTMESRTPNA